MKNMLNTQKNLRRDLVDQGNIENLQSSTNVAYKNRRNKDNKSQQ